MKNITHYIGIGVGIIALLIGCGPSEEEQQEKEQARQDSLEQVRQEQRMEQQRQDSLAESRTADSTMDESDASGPSSDVTFSDDGAFTLQAASWRSQQKAQAEVEEWKDRGFTDAFVVKNGDERTGDVWFRVRIGRVESRQDAMQLQQTLQDAYQVQTWIANAQ